MKAVILAITNTILPLNIKNSAPVIVKNADVMIHRAQNAIASAIAVIATAQNLTTPAASKYSKGSL